MILMWKPDNVYINTFIANIQCIYDIYRMILLEPWKS